MRALADVILAFIAIIGTITVLLPTWIVFFHFWVAAAVLSAVFLRFPRWVAERFKGSRPDNV